jgi:acetylglutamate kinase
MQATARNFARGEKKMADTVVIKCGGSVLSELSEAFFHSLKEMKSRGMNIVIVHGGGPEIGQMLKQLNIKSEFVNGLRKTTNEVLEVVEMILAGKVNKQLVSLLQKKGLKAIGLSGIDANLIEAKPMDVEHLGYVGEVTHVNHSLLQQLAASEYIPVIAPIGFDQTGQKYNINADTAAGAVAMALEAKHLLFVTDVPGILRNGTLVEHATVEMILEMIDEGTIYGGMIPKVKAAMESIAGSLREVIIVSGKLPFFSANGEICGTKVMKEAGVY